MFYFYISCPLHSLFSFLRWPLHFLPPSKILWGFPLLPVSLPLSVFLYMILIILPSLFLTLWLRFGHLRCCGQFGGWGGSQSLSQGSYPLWSRGYCGLKTINRCSDSLQLSTAASRPFTLTRTMWCSLRHIIPWQYMCLCCVSYILSCVGYLGIWANYSLNFSTEAFISYQRWCFCCVFAHQKLNMF